MKRVMALCMLLVMTLSLSACGGAQEDPAPRRFEVTDPQMLADAGVFSEELEVLEGDIPFALYLLADYGLTLKDLEECSAMRSAGATCEEVAVLVFDGDDADARHEKVELARQALEDYVQNQIDSNADYRPNEIPKLENALIEGRGNRIVLVVAEDVEQAKELLEIE